MTLNEYQKLAMTTCMESCKNDTYMLFGLMAEVGEVADKIAKSSVSMGASWYLYRMTLRL